VFDSVPYSFLTPSAAKQAEHRVGSAMDRSRGILSGRRILVVEDEAGACLMLETSYRVRFALCWSDWPAQSALTLLEHEPIDCAVLDINLSTARRFLSLKP